MADETAEALKEIAGLLKRRVEQEDAVAGRAIESGKRAAEMATRMQNRMESPKMPTEAGGRPLGSFSVNREEMQAKMEVFREEDRQFKQRLLNALEGHNALLREILNRLGKPPIV